MAQEPVEFSTQAEELIACFRQVPHDAPERMRRRPTKELGTLMADLRAAFRIGMETPEHTIRENWPAVVGPANAMYSHAVEIDQRGRLLVTVVHSVVRQELFHHRQTILARIRALPACAHVKDLFLRAS